VALCLSILASASLTAAAVVTLRARPAATAVTP